MRGIRLSPEVAFPLTAITETFGILAARGAGKSNAAAVMAEGMFAAKLPFVVVDPVRAWYGLRSSADGKSPGLPIPIFGGRHGDVPLERGGGDLVADLVVDQGLTCILDISDFDSEAAKKQFLLTFDQRLYRRNEHPLHLFLEEADEYIPQRPMRDEAHLLRAWENIVRRGRGRGLGITLITQRSAAVNKNVLTQVQTLIPMRTTGPQDIAAIGEWVKYHQQSRELLSSLPSLQLARIAERSVEMRVCDRHQSLVQLPVGAPSARAAVRPWRYSCAAPKRSRSRLAGRSGWRRTSREPHRSRLTSTPLSHHAGEPYPESRGKHWTAALQVRRFESAPLE